MPEVNAAASVLINPDRLSAVDGQNYADRCQIVVNAANAYRSLRTNQGDKERSLASLATSWHHLDPKFDDETLQDTLSVLNLISELADASRWSKEGSRPFFEEFKLQRKDLINNNFNHLREIYLTTSDTKLKSSLYRAFMEHIIQSPKEAMGEMEFCLEHFDSDSGRGYADELYVLKGLLSPESNERFDLDVGTELDKLRKLAFEQARQMIEDDSSGLSDTSKGVVIHVLAKAAYAKDGPLPIKFEVQAYLSNLIEQWGLSEIALMRAWSQTGTSTTEKPAVTTETFIANNIEEMYALEKLRPGICKTLFDEFGICDFERYSQQVLIAQYDNRNSDMPYGVAVVAQKDHNGAFSAASGNSRLMRDLRSELDRVGYGLRIYEADGRDAIKSLFVADKRYGEQNKITLALIAQHGSEEAIGGNASAKAIRKTHVRKALAHRLNRRVQELRELFAEDPTLILDSCRTAPIGVDIKEFGVNIVAPETATSLIHITVRQYKGGHIRFHGTYEDPDAAVHLANPDFETFGEDLLDDAQKLALNKRAIGA